MEEVSSPPTKIEQKIKEKMLDEAFKKAEVSRGLRQPKPVKTPVKKPSKKTSPKIGIILIIIAIIGLIVIYITPWAYIKYDAGEKQIEASIYKDFRIASNEDQQINDFFESLHYIGLSVDDFIIIPKSVSYGFLSLILLGFIFIIFGIVDKIRNFSYDTSTIFYFIFTAIIIIPSTFIVLSVIKILGSHFLLHHNMHLIGSSENLSLFFPAVFILIVIGFITIKLALSMMKMTLKELQKTKEIDTSEQLLSYSAYRSEMQ